MNNLKPGDNIYILTPKGRRLKCVFLGETTAYKNWFVVGRKNHGTDKDPYVFWPGGKNQIALSEECSDDVIELARQRKLTYFRYIMPQHILLKKGNKDEQH